MDRKIRILQLAPRFPFPLDDGGKIGIANILKEFHLQGADVTFLTFADTDIPQQQILEAEKYCDLHILNHSTKNTKPRMLKALVSKSSLYITKHSNLSVQKYLTELVKHQKFDVVHIDHTCMIQHGLLVKELLGLPVGLRMHNIEWMIWKRYADTLSKLNPLKYFILQQAALLMNYEIVNYPEMDICFAITDMDKTRALEMAPESNVKIASAGVNPEEWKPDPEINRNPNEIVLATTYNWIHNVYGIKWYLDYVHPIVKKEIPQYKLTLIGKDAPDWLVNFPDPSVNVIGYVDKVQPYYNRASLFITPLFVGSGIRIKILEAMSMELPVVATSIAAEGINAQDSQGLFIADDPQGFADRIIQILAAGRLMKGIQSKAREFILENFLWKDNVKIMLDQYSKLI